MIRFRNSAIAALILFSSSFFGLSLQTANAESVVQPFRAAPPRLVAPRSYQSYCEMNINGVTQWVPCTRWRRGDF